MRATWPTHLTLPNLFTIIIVGAQILSNTTPSVSCLMELVSMMLVGVGLGPLGIAMCMRCWGHRAERLCVLVCPFSRRSWHYLKLGYALWLHPTPFKASDVPNWRRTVSPLFARLITTLHHLFVSCSWERITNLRLLFYRLPSSFIFYLHGLLSFRYFACSEIVWKPVSRRFTILQPGFEPMLRLVTFSWTVTLGWVFSETFDFPVRSHSISGSTVINHPIIGAKWFRYWRVLLPIAQNEYVVRCHDASR
jgi:hypothetical protein